MSTSAFGVDHGSEIYKKDKAYEKPGDDYRSSALSGINPRSKTYVKRGTGPQRVLLPAIGGTVGTAVGGAIGRGSPALAGPLAMAGGIGGASLGLRRNVKSGDTVSYHRRTGKKATDKFGNGEWAFNVYGDEKK